MTIGMRNIVNTLLVVLVFTACSQQQRVSNHTPPLDYGDKGPAKYADQLMNKLESGIDFVASGNEPFWSVDVNFDQNITFKVLEGDSISVATPKGTKLMDVAATSYRVKTDSDYFEVIIYDKSCEDGMSGKEFPKSVEINYEKKRYTGCGAYLSDYRLNDIWVLESINQVAPNIASFPKGLPRMELNLALNQAFVFAGCNEFSSAMEVRGKRIHFGRFTGTLMACPNMNFESDYLSKLANRAVPFDIEPGKLILQVGDDSSYQYKKVD
jgi:uncharacterized membrane protein/heat shock protein HslJ